MIGDGWSGRHPHLPEHGGIRRTPRARSDRLNAEGLGVAADTAYTACPGRGPMIRVVGADGPATRTPVSTCACPARRSRSTLPMLDCPEQENGSPSSGSCPRTWMAQASTDESGSVTRSRMRGRTELAQPRKKACQLELEDVEPPSRSRTRSRATPALLLCATKVKF